MRSLWSRYLLKAFILAAALFCWVHALILTGDMFRSAGSVSFRYGTGGISGAAAERMLEEESAPFAAWLQESGRSVSEPEFSRDSTVQILEIAGDAELVLPADELLYGFLPMRGSADTCAIDAATAYALWGGMDVSGETLLYDDREYTVTGVFSRPQNTMLMQSRLKTDTVFPYLELSVSGMNTARRQSDKFRARYSLPEPDILTDHLETAAMLRQLALLPVLLAAALLLWKVLRRSFGKPVSSLGRAGFMVVMVAGVLISAWAIGFSPVVPAAAIPGRWSDFSFWSGFAEDMAERIRLSRAFAWPATDLLRLQVQHLLFLYSGLALTGFVIGILWKRGKGLRDGIFDTEKNL